jgi:hypothetical protein
MSDLDAMAWTTGTDPANLGAPAPRRRRHPHEWCRSCVELGVASHCIVAGCGIFADDPRIRRGRSSGRLGKDQERRIERVYGPRKVGEFGDAVDHLGRDFKWQSKATRSLPPKWLAAITAPTWRAMVPRSILDPMAHMAGIGTPRIPLVIRSYVRQGVATRDWIFVVERYWTNLHGGSYPMGYLVIPGADFLAIHGRDAAPLMGPGVMVVVAETRE